MIIFTSYRFQFSDLRVLGLHLNGIVMSLFVFYNPEKYWFHRNMVFWLVSYVTSSHTFLRGALKWYGSVTNRISDPNHYLFQYFLRQENEWIVECHYPSQWSRKLSIRHWCRQFLIIFYTSPPLPIPMIEIARGSLER